MADTPTLTEIADRARVLYTSYPQAAAEHARDKRNLEDWQNLASVGRLKEHEKVCRRESEGHYKDSLASCLRWVQEVTSLALVVAERLPSLWPQLRLVQVGVRWHEVQGFDWNAAIGELRAIEAAALEAADRPEVPQEPKNYLLNWREVLAAIGRKNTAEDRRQVSRINEETGGPISVPKRGSQPKVERGALLIWWNRLEIQWADAANQAAGERIDADAQYHYGQSGEVAPGIGGGVKRRRSDRKP